MKNKYLVTIDDSRDYLVNASNKKDAVILMMQYLKKNEPNWIWGCIVINRIENEIN